VAGVNTTDYDRTTKLGLIAQLEKIAKISPNQAAACQAKIAILRAELGEAAPVAVIAVAKVAKLRFDSPALRRLHPVYRALLKALHNMARNTDDRVVETTYVALAARAGRLFGRFIAPKTAHQGVLYMDGVRLVALLSESKPTQRYPGGPWRRPAAEVRVPLLRDLNLAEIEAALLARPTPIANPKDAARKRRSRARTSQQGVLLNRPSGNDLSINTDQ
jgi:hypothetical protein